jgi:hypothetical protein
MGQNPDQPTFGVSVFNMGDVESGGLVFDSTSRGIMSENMNVQWKIPAAFRDCRSELSSIPDATCAWLLALNELRR